MSDTGSTFHAFFDSHYGELSRLAYLLTGEASVADDLAADALAQVWRHWARAGDPAAYARGAVAELCRTWLRRERGLLGLRTGRHAPGRDVPGALSRLPHRRRACVVLAYAFGLPERDIARALGISVGAVRGRTSRGARQLAELLGGAPEVTRLGGWEAAR